VTTTPFRVCLLAVGVALAAAACGSSSKKAVSGAASAPTSAATSSTSPPSSSALHPPSGSAAGGASAALRAALAGVGAAAPSGFTVSLAKGPQGIFLIGPNGHTLYFRTTDAGTTSSCTGACATTWPALTATGPVTGGPGVNKADLGTADGQVANQVTAFGHLLYYYSRDTAPGQTTGVGIPTWFLLGPVGNQMAPR
jgi:predicted lipoprotein with Yx(FWY)xxD motif